MRTRKPTAIALRAAGLAALTLLLSPGDTRSQTTCGDDAARNLMVSSLMDTWLNPPAGEDQQFITREDTTFPNIMFLLDTSGSMQRLPPDGPGSLGGSSQACTADSQCPARYTCTSGHCKPALPAGALIDNPASSTQQTAAFTAPRVVGCDDDPIFNATPNVGDNPMLASIPTRRFYTPCGTAATVSVGSPYAGHASVVTGGVDYAREYINCPYYTSSNNQQTGGLGFDPDFYAQSPSGTETTANGKPAFFGRDLVFHDANYVPVVTGEWNYERTNLDFRTNFGNGWTDNAVFPVRRSNNDAATIAEFCATQGTTPQGLRSRAEICQSCLEKKGWYYDGVILEDTNGDRFPSIWYTGNYLNFFPPKFLVARKTVKDVIAKRSRIRMALATFDYPNGWTLQRDFNPSCQMEFNTTSNFDSNRAAFVTAVNAVTSFQSGTPLAMSLFDVGRYYHSPGLPWFGSSWEKNNSSYESSSNDNQYSICYLCQTSSVVVLTDGEPSPGSGLTPNDGDRLPSGGTTLADTTSGKYAGAASTGIKDITSTDCPQCANFSGENAWKDSLAKVAWYMHNMDLRDNAESTWDCKKNGGKQVLDTYTVGFATSQLPDAKTILHAAAEAGGGKFVPAENPQTLAEGLTYILEKINERATSFSVATVSTLQTTSGRAVIVPRFEPKNGTSRWRGHVLRFDLYSEFVNACDAKLDGTGTGDLDCDGSCTSVFLQDKSRTTGQPGDFITEDGAGNFVKSDPGTTPVCSQAPKCASVAGKSCSVASSAPANPWWDAGALLAGTGTSQKWKSRRVYTVVDDTGDGKIDGSDRVIRLEATDTAATAIMPYLGLGGGTVCNALATEFQNAGASTFAASVQGSTVDARTACTKAFIRLVLGADLFNSMKRTSYPPSSMDDLWDRDWMLGDVFHSSPVVVDPPLPRDGVICPNGLSNQCLQSLWDTPTKNGKDAYDGYAKSTTYKDRTKLVLVGANDGLLHAFHAGEWHGNPTPGTRNTVADDPSTTALDESLPPFNGYYDRGTGEELWAFLPPDMLAKLRLLIEPKHQFFVDGTAMVRDVWVDGTGNSVGTGIRNDIKEAGEYHTVAVVGERRGGTHYFALDVTDATGSTDVPEFLWIYPQPNDPETLDFAESYDDFLPRAPPIGPVRLEADSATGAATADTPRMSVGTGEVAYHERWVVFLNGGFDPQYVRGRGVHMVDVWTGKEVFDFSYDASHAVKQYLRFPVPAVVGMVGWGGGARRASGETNDYFFDTATFGDAGGQLWALRFHRPGKIGTSGKVENWYGGRIFQMGTENQDCRFCGGQPFFYMTANIPLPSNGAYRVFAGTGDRYNLLDKDGGTCGPDNIRACVLRGCKVEMPLDATATDPMGGNLFESYGLGGIKRGLSHSTCGTSTNVLTASGSETAGPGCAAAGATVVSARAQIKIWCPQPSSTTAVPTTEKKMTASCTFNADGYDCRPGIETRGAELPLAGQISRGNFFYSLLVFDETGPRAPFDSATAAATYDGARLWLNQTGVDASYGFSGSASSGLVTISAKATNPSPLADASSPGWAIYYNQGPTVAADGYTYNVYWADERTSSGTSTLGDIYWNTVQRASGTIDATSCVHGSEKPVSKCGTTEARRIATKYGANIETGGLPSRFKDENGNVVRSMKAALLVPTQADQPTVFVNQAGQIAVGLTAVNPERGATNVGMTDPIDPTMDFGFMEVSEPLHACRHAATSDAASCD